MRLFFYWRMEPLLYRLNVASTLILYSTIVLAQLCTQKAKRSYLNRAFALKGGAPDLKTADQVPRSRDDNSLH
jgi:hypothetical protein